MFSRQTRRTRRSGINSVRPNHAGLERLEARELMAYSPLGYSLPDLTVNGFASTAAAWGGNLTVTVNVANIGASTTTEPFQQTPLASSTADAGPTTVAVFASPSKHLGAKAVLIGSVPVSNGLTQNTAEELTNTFTLPNRPSGFAGDGGKVYLYFVINPTGAITESNGKNDTSGPVTLQIEAPLPELTTLSLDVPSTMQPGDSIQPNIRIANYGTADTDAQAPVTVELVASTTSTLNSGSVVLATYTIDNISSTSDTASKVPVYGDINVDPADNVVTITGDVITLPTSSSSYYIGVVIDPNNQIKELGKIAGYTPPKGSFQAAKLVAPVAGLPTAGQTVLGGAANVPLFPNTVSGLLIGGSADGSTFPAQLNVTSTSSTTTTASGLNSIDPGSSPGSTGSGSSNTGNSTAQAYSFPYSVYQGSYFTGTFVGTLGSSTTITSPVTVAGGGSAKRPTG